ncbi:MAG TPA: ornithine cyclodeaminase family protein [Planctomycetota bacterium]
MKTLLLGRKDLEKILTMELAVPAVEAAFAAHGRGEAVMPPKIYLPLPKHHGDFRAMPAYLDGAVGVKWVNMHPENPRRHKLPAVMGVYVLSDPDTAAPLAILDGTLLTAFRTGAAGAVASKYLAPKDPATIGLVGCGTQARYLLRAHRLLFPRLRPVLYDVAPEAVARFAAEEGGHPGAVDQAASCDIVCTTTPARGPVVYRAFVGISTHINAMGADAPGKQEIDPEILNEATVVVDDILQACESGEVNVPLHAGTYAREKIYGTLGQVVTGLKRGRRSTEITLFDSTGLAIQDLALARAAVDVARRMGLGTDFELVGDA